MRCQPDVLDFTDKAAVNELWFYFGKTELKLVLKDEDIPFVVSVLRMTVFAKGNKIVVWNWKNFASFILAKTKKPYHIDAAIIDLKIIEYYAGRRNNAPKTLPEALNRLKDLISSGIWKEIESIYKKFHMPLMTTVIPALENAGILDSSQSQKVFAYYDIEGQENGRLKCSGEFKFSYVPHTMSPEIRESLKPCNYDQLFMNFDFKGMEVFVLSWMSKDPLLQELCDTSDIYVSLYEKIFQEKCEVKNERDLAKKIFLPVIYGQKSHSLSQKLGIALDAAEFLISRVYTLFPTALSFIEGYQKQVQELGYAKDIFGRRRTFEVGKEYFVRNFAIQSPASLICLEKLTHLYFSLKDKADIAYTVHDGYVVYATKENWKTIFKLGNQILSSESEFCPGLRLKVACRAGRNLNDLKPLARKGE